MVFGAATGGADDCCCCFGRLLKWIGFLSFFNPENGFSAILGILWFSVAMFGFSTLLNITSQ
jgi:hypothetical protein